MRYRLQVSFSAILVLCCLQVSCVTPQRRPRHRPAASIVLEQINGSIDLIRQNQVITPGPEMRLERGDEIETFARSGAIIRFLPGNDEVRLMPQTHVRLHSIFVFIGEIFVKAKGFFQVENEFVELDVEGTQFWFRVTHNQRVYVRVTEGSVRCRSKARRWPTFMIRAGEEYVIPRAEAPSLHSSRGGWCCADGRLSRFDRVDCQRRGGRFFKSKREARRFCRPPDPYGWCCDNGKLFQDKASGCERKRGRFFESEKEARRSCRPPDPYGWCCDNGKLFQDKASGCERKQGRFFESEKEARRSCRPPDPYGWCCDSGRLFQDKASGCERKRGRFFESEKAARNFCRPPDPVGWCCDDGKVYRERASGCRKSKGRFFDSERDARRFCLPILR